MQRCLCGTAEGDADIHEVGIGCSPLISLSGAHGPTKNSSGMFDAEKFSDELVLSLDTVLKCHLWERLDIGIGRRY